jgi:hypothetical protein
LPKARAIAEPQRFEGIRERAATAPHQAFPEAVVAMPALRPCYPGNEFLDQPAKEVFYAKRK